MAISASQVVMYMNILVGAILVLCALVGFGRGLRKSIYYMIATAIVFVLTWIFMTPLCNLLMGIDLSSLNQSFEINETTVPLTNLKDTVSTIVSISLFGGVDISDTATLEVVLGVVSIVFKIVIFIITILLAFTLYKVIFDIIWNFFKPKKVEDKKGKMKTPKPSFTSRLAGLGVGAVKGLLYAFLLFFLFAGAVSIIENVDTAFEETSTQETYGMVIVDDSATLITLSDEVEGQTSSNPLDEYRDILDLVTSYRDSIPGKVFGSIKLGDAKLDEAMFDALFSFNGTIGEYTTEDGKTKKLKYNIKLRKELQKAVSAYAKVAPLFEGGFDLEKLKTFDAATLQSAIDDITELELVKVIIPVGLEVVFLGDVIKTEDEDLKKVIDQISLDELKGIDYGAEFKNLGYVLVDVVDILSDNVIYTDKDTNETKVNFTAISSEKLQKVFDSLGDLEIVNYVAPLAVSYVMTMDSLKESMEEVGISLEDLGIEEITEWNKELVNLGSIFSAFLDLGIDASDIENLKFDNVSMEKVDTLTDAIFNSIIISKAIPVVANIGINAMGEYGEIIEIPDNVNWKNELSPLLKAAITLLNTGIVDEMNKEDADLTNVFNNLTDKDIDDTAYYLSQSSILKNALNGLIEKLMTSSDDLKDLNIKGFDTADSWTEKEISSIFKAAKDLFGMGILTSDDILKTLGELDDSKIESLANNLTNSKFIIKNLGAILDYALSNMDSETTLTIQTLDESEWTKEEVSNIFLAFKDIASSGLLDSDDATEAFKNLSNQTIDNLGTHISSSKFLTRNLTEIMKMLLQTIEMEDLEIKGFENSEDWTKKEIVVLLKSAKIIVSCTDDLTKLINLKEDDLDYLVDSKLITNLLVDFLKVYSKEGKDLDIIKGVDAISNELWQDKTVTLLSTDYTIDYNANTIYITNVPTSIDVDKYYVYILKDGIETKYSSCEKLYIPFDESINDGEIVRVEARENGEIRNLFNAVSAVIGNVSEGIDSDKIISKLTALTDNDLDLIVKSKVLSETLIYQIEEFSKGEDAIINIPSGNLTLTNPDGSSDRTYWLEQGNKHGELYKALKAITVLFKGTDLNNISLSTDMITKLDDIGIYTIIDSEVISETLICKIEDFAKGEDAIISIPEGKLTLTNPDGTKDRTSWKEQGSVHGELYNCVYAIKVICSEGLDLASGSFNTSTITNLKDEDIKTVCKSIIISDTIAYQIELLADGTDPVIYIPTELQKTSTTIDRDKWMNENEAYNILNALKLVFNGGDIDTSNLKLQAIIENKDTILKSLIISETIKGQITKVDGIDIPADLSVVSLEGWKNTYNSDGSVKTYGELSHMLASLNLVLSIDENTTINSFNVDSIKFNTVISKSDEILKSLIITNTIKNKISDNDSIVVPNTLSKTSLEGWKNIYDSNDNLKSKGEISHILQAISKIANITDATTIDDFNVDIKLGNLISERTMILQSLIVSETVKSQIIDAATKAGAILALPNNYDDKSSKNYIVWNNTYNNDTLVSTGEIDNILASIGQLLPDTNISFDAIGTLNYSAIFDKTSQKTIISSKLVSETIIAKVEEMDALVIPTSASVNLNNKDDRSNWWDVDNGELVYFLNAISSILTDSQKENLDSSINLSVDTVYSKMIDTDIRTELLKSYIVSETITVNFMNLSSVFTIPSVENAGVDLSNSGSRDNWYYINANRTIVHKELWNLITSINLLLGDSYTSSTNFTIDQLLANPSFVPTLDASKNNTNKTVETFLQSKLIEEVFVKIIKDIVIEGAMKDYMNAPTGGYLWYKFGYEQSNEATKEYDLQTVMESIYLMNNAGLSYNMNMTKDTLKTLDVDKLADSFVVSRTFRGSIEKCLGGLFQPLYVAAYSYGKYYSHVNIATWDNVKLTQADYDSPKTKLEASTSLRSKLKTIIDNINSVY